MKAILMSIKPEHLVNILNGKKTLEIRKSVPKNFKGWVYLYCTKSKLKLLFDYLKKVFFLDKLKIKNDFILNGKVVARFWFDEYSEFDNSYYYQQKMTFGYHRDYQIMLEKSCLSDKDILDYCKGKSFYALHIKNLEIFDKPKELSEFYKKVEFLWGDTGYCNKGGEPIEYHPIEKAPQSWMYVEVKI